MASGRLLWINKTSHSTSLSHSEDVVRLSIFRHAQRTARSNRKATAGRDSTSTLSRRAKKRDDRIVEDDQAVFDAMICEIRTVQSAAVHRMQMTAQFLDLYYADDLPYGDSVRNKLQQWFNPERGAAARVAADGILVLHAARMRDSQDLFREGLRHHQNAIRLLGDALKKSPNPAQDDSLFGAVEVLGVCDKEFFSANGDSPDDGNDAHARGMHALILTRGPEVLDHGITRDLTLSFLHVPLMSSLLARKACAFGQPEWQARLYPAIALSGTACELTAIACLLPGLIEEADRLLGASDAALADHTQLLSRLTALEARFQDWIASHYRSHPENIAYQVAATDDAVFSCQALGLSGYPFASLIEHGSFVSVLTHYNYWTVLFLLRRTINEVGIVATEDLESFLGVSTTWIRRQWADACTECADMFCQSVLSALSLQSSQRRIAIEIVFVFMQAYIGQRYVQTGDSIKSEWCADVARYAREETARAGLANIEGGRIGWLSKQYLGWFNMMEI